jgi:hypothetical protein
MEPDPPAIFVINLQEANKKLIFFLKLFSLIIFEGTVHLHNLSKTKSQKEVTKRYGRNQGFSDPDPGRPKKHTDPDSDPDPKYG